MRKNGAKGFSLSSETPRPKVNVHVEAIANAHSWAVALVAAIGLATTACCGTTKNSSAIAGNARLPITATGVRVSSMNWKRK